MSYVAALAGALLLIALVHFYLTGIKKHNEKLQMELEQEKLRAARAKARDMSLDDLAKRAAERRAKARQTSEEG